MGTLQHISKKPLLHTNTKNKPSIICNNHKIFHTETETSVLLFPLEHWAMSVLHSLQKPATDLASSQLTSIGSGLNAVLPDMWGPTEMVIGKRFSAQRF